MIDLSDIKKILAFLQFFVVLLLSALFPSRNAQAQAQFDHSHLMLAATLDKHVELSEFSSSVDYAGLKGDSFKLESYLFALQSIDKNTYDTFTNDQKLSFLVNAYNAFTLKLVIDNYPLKSIKDLGSFFRSPWRISFFTLLGEDRDLDYIEHTMIRGNFSDARIHFTLVCASRGCPRLSNRAYLPETWDSQAEEATRIFLKDRSRNYFDKTAKILYLSKLFSWYGDDFVKAAGSVKAFVAPRMANNKDEENVLMDEKTAVKFLNYDWSLNDVGGKK